MYVQCVINLVYLLVIGYIAIEAMAIWIVSFHRKKMMIFHTYVSLPDGKNNIWYKNLLQYYPCNIVYIVFTIASIYIYIYIYIAKYNGKFTVIVMYI